MELPIPSPRNPDDVPGGTRGEAAIILLVDDDRVLRKNIRDFLVGAGFHVLEARNSYDGLFLCAQYGPCIDLLITEINLLPVGGVKLAENVARVWPQVQTICMSQCFDAPGLAHWMHYLGARFLRKPFTPLELYECALAALGRATGETGSALFPARRKMLD